MSNERNKFVAGLCGTLAALPLTGTMMDQSSRHLEIATWTVECPLSWRPKSKDAIGCDALTFISLMCVVFLDR